MCKGYHSCLACTDTVPCDNTEKCKDPDEIICFGCLELGANGVNILELYKINTVW